MANIDFITFLTKHSLGYANFLRLTGEHLKSRKHTINWKCVLSNKARNIPDNFKCMDKISFKYDNASMRHGLTINSILPKIENDYVIISDVDVAITHKNWDDIIVNVLDEGYSCFGTPNIDKYREPIDFPNVPFFCFKKEIMKKVSLDFTPMWENNDIKKIPIKTEEDAKKFGREIGTRVVYDSGCKLKENFIKEGLKFKCLETIVVTSDKIQLKFKDLEERNAIVVEGLSIWQLAEFHYNGNVFLTHLGRSRKASFNKGFVKNWVDRIVKYIEQEYNVNIFQKI